MQLIGLALSSSLFFFYFVISAWIVWLEFEIAPSFPLLGLLTVYSELVRGGELQWFWLVRELAVLFLLIIALGVFFLYLKEKALQSHLPKERGPVSIFKNRSKEKHLAIINGYLENNEEVPFECFATTVTHGNLGTDGGGLAIKGSRVLFLEKP